MIVLNVLYKAKEGMRDAFLNQVEEQGILKKIREEQGNICYEYYISKEHPEEILLLERWENQQVLDAHLQAPHMEELRVVKEQCIADTEIAKFHV